MTGLPLAGRRILVTRAAHQAGKLSESLRALGAEPVEVPVLEIRPPASFEQLDKALRQLHAYDWLIFTSANTVKALVERVAALGIDATLGSSSRIAAVGAATARAAEDGGFSVTAVPESYVAESLVRALKARVSGRRILLARAAVARDTIPDALRAAGATVDVVDAYRNAIPEAAPELLRAALKNGIDATTFTSSSSVTHLAEVAANAGIAFPFRGVPAISIGPITSQTLRESSWPPAAESAPHDISGLVAAVANYFSAA